MLSTLLLLSLTVHVGALDAAAIQSFDKHHPFLAGHDPVDLKLRAERILQTDEIKCPICDRLGTRSLLPLVIPDSDYSTDTCQKINSNEFYEENKPVDGITPPCAVYQDIFEEYCCEISGLRPPHECETKVMTDLFTSYDTAVVPRASRPAYLSVNTLLTYWAVGKISLEESSVEIHIDVTLSWNDPRLAWDFTEDNCATSILVRASLDKELTDIWVPGLDLLNREIGVQSFPAVPAKVYSDGTVVWRRSGRITAFCSFTGLRRLPYDTLGCQFVFGDEAINKVDYNLVVLGNRHKGLQFADYTQTYAEYTVVEEKTASISGIGSFAINFYFRRDKGYYIVVIILPTILFAYISFGQFFFDPASGDRISFVLTVLLVVVAQDIITSELLPICKEDLWLNDLNTSALLFVLIGVFEALIFYCVSGKQSRQIVKDLVVENSASLARNNAHSPDHNSVLSVEAQSDYDSSSNIEVPKAEIRPTSKLPSSRIEDLKSNLRSEINRSVGPTCLGGTGKRIRLKLLKIMIWVDFVFRYALPISFTIYLMIMFGTNYKLEDDGNKIWLFKEL